MIRLLLWIVGGLVLGGIIHIVTVLGMPRYAENDAWSRSASFGPDFQFNPLPRVGPGPQTIPLLDPAFAQAICRFTLEGGPVRVRTAPPDVYWSLALFDRRGVNLYNVNERGVGQKPVDLLVATQEQVAQIRENPPDDFGDIIIVDWHSTQGLAVIRLFAPTETAVKDAKAFFAQAKCQVNPINQ